MPDNEFDEKIDRASKAIDVMKKLGDMFNFKKPESNVNTPTQLDAIEGFLLNHVIKKLDKILIKLDYNQEIKKIIAEIHVDRFILETDNPKEEGYFADDHYLINAKEIIDKLQKLI